jgi:hypothetical protein
MSRHGQPDARTFLFRGGGMRIIRNLITYRDAGQVGALLDIKGQASWPLRFLGRRHRCRRGRLRRPVRTGLVLITHRFHPLRQDPGVPVDSRANPRHTPLGRTGIRQPARPERKEAARLTGSAAGSWARYAADFLP